MKRHRNKNRSALGARLHEPAPPHELALSAAEAEGCRSLWQERTKKKAEIQDIENRLSKAITSVSERFGIPIGTQVNVNFETGTISVPAKVVPKDPPQEPPAEPRKESNDAIQV
jgi:hypothetical protein